MLFPNFVLTSIFRSKLTFMSKQRRRLQVPLEGTKPGGKEEPKAGMGGKKETLLAYLLKSCQPIVVGTARQAGGEGVRSSFLWGG